MKLIAICDLEGKIEALATMPTGGLRPSFPNLPSTKREVELDLPDGFKENELYKLRDLRSSHYVDLHSTKLVAGAAK